MPISNDPLVSMIVHLIKALMTMSKIHDQYTPSCQRQESLNTHQCPDKCNCWTMSKLAIVYHMSLSIHTNTQRQCNYGTMAKVSVKTHNVVLGHLNMSELPRRDSKNCSLTPTSLSSCHSVLHKHLCFSHAMSWFIIKSMQATCLSHSKQAHLVCGKQ